MLKIELNGKGVINPNEEIRNQFRQIINEKNEYSTEEIYDTIYDIIEEIKEINYFEYISIITLMYKDVYCYYNYLLKTNETNFDILEQSRILDVNRVEDVLNAYYNNDKLFLSTFVYVLNLNNLFYIKMLSNLNEYQNMILKEICPLHVYDEIALNQDYNFSSLEDYYVSIINENIIVDDIANDIMYFLEYLYNYNRNIYYNYINSIIKKIYKYCYYYLNNSYDIEKDDLEIRIIELTNGKSDQEIGEELFKNKDMLNEIILRVFDDMELGYPSIYTNNGYKLITEKDLNDYIVKTKKKH